MLGAAVANYPYDALLPGLAQASDPVAMLPLLAAAAGLTAVAPDTLDCSVQVIKHWPSKRCTLRYELADRRRPMSPPMILVGKVYRRAAVAARAHATTLALRALYANPEEPYQVPEPVALHPELGLVLHQHAPGLLLDTVASPDGDVAPFAHAGRWLAHLHEAPAIADLRARPVEHELDRLDRWRSEVMAELPRRERSRVESAGNRLLQLGAELERTTTTMTHRDFYPGNVLWDGQSICVIDFDSLALGVPILDVGRFLAQIEKLSRRTTGRGDSLTPAASAFLDGYLRAGAGVSQDGLHFALAHTFLNLAADEVQRRRTASWMADARLFARRACEEIDRAGLDEQ